MKEPPTNQPMPLSIRSRTRRVVGLNPIWGSDFFCVLLWSILYIALYFLYNTNISGIGWLNMGRLVLIYGLIYFPGEGTI